MWAMWATTSFEGTATNQRASQREKGLVDVGPFVVANAQTTKLIEPRERALHDPAPPA